MPVGRALSVCLRGWAGALVFAAARVSGDTARTVHAGNAAPPVLHGKVLRAALHGFLRTASRHAGQLARAADAEASAGDAARSAAGTGANRSRARRFLIRKVVPCFPRLFPLPAHSIFGRIDGPARAAKNGDMTAPAIETENLTKEYPHGFLNLKKRRSLEGLNMRVETGEIFGFIGPNGAGKTTAIKLLMRLIFPTAGTARIFGQPISDINLHRDVGYLPEQPYFYDYLTAAELLDYFARIHDLRAAERKQRVATMLKKVGLETAGKIQLRKYSKGMLQRAGVAQAILHDPKVVILDEPMSGLDPIGRREVRDIILELKQEGKTVLFSTHILSDAEMLCDRVGVIVGGKLRGVGAPEQLVGVKAKATEILFELAGPAAASLLAKATRTGDRYRLQVPEAELYEAIDQLRAAGAKILSVAQVKATLEEFFMHLVEADRAQAAAVEVRGK